MSSREIFSFLNIFPDGKKSSDQKEVQTGNTFFKALARRRTTYFWNNNAFGSNPQIMLLPWKQGNLLSTDETVGHASMGSWNLVVAYPEQPGGGTINSYDYRKFRATGVTTSVLSTDIPRVFGAVATYDSNQGVTYSMLTGDNLISLNDVPLEYTQIGIVYQHPMHAGGSDISTSVGTSYVTFSNGHFLDQPFTGAPGFNTLVIASGADAGEYFIRYTDYSNNRLYLLNLDGTLFSAAATASSLPWYAGPGRRAYFNEVSIIQLSTGLVVTGGAFRPGASRNSYILKVIFDKTGSDATAAAAEQQGSYFISLRPYTHGSGLTNFASSTSGWDICRFQDSMLGAVAGLKPYNFNFFTGGAGGLVLNETDQRAWFGYTDNSSNSGIGCWRWKTNEGPREVANYLGTATHASFLTPALLLTTGDIIRDMRISPSDVVYVTIGHASGGNAGLAIINPDLTTTQYNTGAGFPSVDAAGSALDASRTRVGTAADASTNGADQVTSASGAFTAADIGRAIKLTGLGADNGTYLIATIVGGTAVTVTTMAGAGVTFTSQSGGTFEIGNRLYFFFKNGTTGAGKINYMETLVPGTFLTRTVSMTNGANCTVANRQGETAKVTIDPANGNVYWLSNDTQQQINMYDVTANSHAFRTVANVQSPSGGTGSIGTITVFTCIMLNPKFDEIWVGTDQGSVKLVKSSFAGANYKRYYGQYDTTYANPAGYFRPQGTDSSHFYVRDFVLAPDGHVHVFNMTNSSNFYVGAYSRETDAWVYRETLSYYAAGQDFFTPHLIFDSYGTFLSLFPIASITSNNQPYIAIGSMEVQYQWDAGNSQWIPLEVVQGPLPNKSPSDTVSPGCMAKPIHSTLDDVLYGVKLGFTKQGGATPANNEFLGRAAQTATSKTDGATTISTNGFTGSGFVSGDVGRYLRIETGADLNVYKITVFNSSTSITIAKLDGSAVSAAATASSLNYSVWTRGTAGSNAGPETATVMLADGFGKDNTQDFSGITYDSFFFKTLLEEQVEDTKFCVTNPIGAPGGVGMKVYGDTFPRVGSATLASHNLQTTQIRALPASEWSLGGFDGSKLVDGFVDGSMNNAGARGSMYSSPSDGNVWYGTIAGSYGYLTPVSSALGICPMVDLGADAEVGYVIIRGDSDGGSGITWSDSWNGLKATLYKANGPTAPVASATSRTSGTGDLTLTVNNTTITTTGSFLGSISLGPNTDGVAVAGQALFTVTPGTLSQSNVGMILKITSVGDVGSYRITAVDGTGAIATITNLNQTAYLWAGSASGIVYEVRDGVREEDVICVPSIGAPTQRLCIERLLTSTTATVRVPPHTSQSSQNWECAIPTWDKVKRVSHSTEAVAPDVKNNGTWVTDDGREQYDYEDWKIFMDLTDLTVAQRTGRWWQLQMMPRGTASNGGAFYMCSFEFYSPSGARLGVSQYTFTDNSLQNADFLSSHINRFDFIQSSYEAMNTAGWNGVVDLTLGNTLTLNGGADKFMGFQTRRPFTDGVCVAGAGGNFTSATAAFLTSDVGRFLRITTGANAGNYRIATRVSATAVTLTLPSGTAAGAFTGTTGETFVIHEGIAVGGSTPDRIVFLDDLSREYTLASINDALTTLTINEAGQEDMTGKQWEIRRPAFDTSSSTVDSSKLARIVRPETTYPLQSGDIAHDSRGALRFFSEDIGSGNSRSDGAIAGGSGVFTGTGFCEDDVGRLLYITTGVTANLGIWRISVFTSSTSVTVVNAYTGAAVTFSADAAADKVYKVYGDRRFKITKQVTTLRA
jgi:hypothetical protein